jgi:hypothetical protein
MTLWGWRGAASLLDALRQAVQALGDAVPTRARVEVRLGGAGDPLADEVVGELLVEVGVVVHGGAPLGLW